MFRSLITTLFALGLASGAYADSIDINKVNGRIELDAGETAGKLSTVNGSISVSENARATQLSTVNGSVDLGSNASVQSVSTVNGHVALAERARVEGSVDAVNGAISVSRGAVAGGHVGNVNGSIRVDGGEVGGGIETVNGDILIAADSHVRGGIVVGKSDGWFDWIKGLFGAQSKPRIVIGPNAVVEGELQFRREVQLFVSDSARIGPVKGAVAQTFSGANP
ncbi:MAG: hypothetical protein ABIY56_11500 [Dokdonella sp.]